MTQRNLNRRGAAHVAMLLLGGCAFYAVRCGLKARGPSKCPITSNSTVYLIDDDQAVLGALSLLLTAEGYCGSRAPIRANIP